MDMSDDWGSDPEQLVDLASVSALRRRPIPAVLDTSCVRTGLAQQLTKGVPPASLRTAQDGTIRLFMERDTLAETAEKLPLFAEQLGVPTARLVRMFDDDWLPHIRGIALPHELRELDERAAAVRDLDDDDFPAAALAALLSPCILLTHNHKHFRPLGVREPWQGVHAVVAAVDIGINERRFQAVVMVPTAPALAIGAGAKWAVDRFGPIAWVVLGLLAAGGYVAYRHQSPDRREAIRKGVGEIGRILAEEGSRAASSAYLAQELLGTYLVTAPDRQSSAAAIFRQLALSPDSMSAQQLHDSLDESVRPAIPTLRAFLHANKTTIFAEARRGSFRLGLRYSITLPAGGPS